MMLTQPSNLQIKLPLHAIGEQCRQFGVSELAIFGSVLREDFTPRSDVDFLVKFIDNDAGEWMGKFHDLEEALGKLLVRKVDVIDWQGIERSRNPYRREHILKTARLIYAAG